MKPAFLLALAGAALLIPAFPQTAAERDRCANICSQVGMTCLLGQLSDPGPGADQRYVRECRVCARGWCGGTPPAAERPKPEAPELACPSQTDQVSVRVSWSPGKEIKDYTITVGTSPDARDLGTIGPLRNQTSTGVGGIPVGKTIYVKLQAYSNEGEALRPSYCSIKSLEEAGLYMRTLPTTVLTGPSFRAAAGYTAEQCSAACDADPQCKAFTYRRRDPLAQQSNDVCVLKAETAAAVNDACCVSGIKVAQGARLDGSWTRNGTDSVRVELNGNAVVFIDQAGRRVDGRMENGRVVVDLWGASAVVAGNQLRWSNGPVWTRLAGR